jgi:dolichol-phosphate mannosyltransferase
LTGGTVAGWASTTFSVLFIGGIQLFTIGLLGEYIGRIFEEVKSRPLYLVREVIEQDNGKNKTSEKATQDQETEPQLEREHV